MKLRRASLLAPLFATPFALFLAACATTGEGDPRDPLEPLHRAVSGFNQGVDQAIAKAFAMHDIR